MVEDYSKQPYYQDLTKVLVNRLRQSTTWNDLFACASQVFAENIYAGIYALRQIRDPEVQSRDINIQQSVFLGFNYKSDLFTDREYQTLVQFLNMFNRKYKGTKNFISFIGWIKGAHFKMYNLWANGKGKEYGEFERSTSSIVKNNSKIDGTGTKEWYPTSHVELEYDAEMFNIDVQDIYELFYATAPAHLVLTSVVGLITSNTMDLYLKLAPNDYTNGHHVLPCIYQYVAPVFLTCRRGRIVGRSAGTYNDFGYKNGNVMTTENLPRFVTDGNSKSLISNFSFVRDSDAVTTYYNSDHFSIVNNNIPRFDFEKGTTNPIGLFIERKSSNLLLDSTNPQRRTLTLMPGVYTFSGVGKYHIYNPATGSDYVEVENKPYTFILGRIERVMFLPVKIPNFQPWFQLEASSKATSFIPTSKMTTATRDAEVLQLVNFPNPFNECTIVMNFQNDIAQNCCLLNAQVNQFTYLKATRQDSNINLVVWKDGRQINTLTAPYENQFVLGIKKDQINLNWIYQNFILEECPIPKTFCIGSNYGNDCIDGHVLSFSYFPVYINEA